MSESIPPPPGPHPSSEELFRARQEPTWSEAERILAHAVQCAACSEELLLQEAFDQPEPVPAPQLEDAWQKFAARVESQEPSPRPKPVQAPAAPAAAPALRARGRGRAWLALAAAVLVAVVGLSLWSRGPGAPAPTDDTVRGVSAPAGRFEPTGTLSAPPARFLFPRQGERPLRVKLFDAERRYEWTSAPSSQGEVPLPAEEAARLAPGTLYFWTVLDGEEVPAQSFVWEGKAGDAV